MPLYEVPVYIKVAAPSAQAAADYLKDTECLEAVHARGLRDCVRVPEGDTSVSRGWRSPNAAETGVAGHVIGQPVRLASWRASASCMFDIKEPVSQRVNSPAL